MLLFLTAIVVFIGHGSDPLCASQIPPSSDQKTGRLIFLSREINQAQSGLGTGGFIVHGPATNPSGPNYNKRYDDLSDFQLVAGKTLFICQACYSGNTINKMTKSK